MDSALPNAKMKVATGSASEGFLHQLTAFLMLGGGSLILMAVLLIIRSPQIVMQENVRWLLQITAGTGTIMAVLLSYPHFIWSYRFAYQQGAAFIVRHSGELLLYPSVLALLIAFSLIGWSFPLSRIPWLLSIDSALHNVGIDLYWSRYLGLGQLLLASLLILQTIMSGYHFCMQAFGVALACGEDGGYKLTMLQKHVLRFNMYALWGMNLFSGYTFFTMLNNRQFAYHPAQFPQAFYVVSYVAFAFSLIGLVALVLLPNFKQGRRPPFLFLVPIVAVWIWLQPFFQPYGFQAWVVPLAHGAQYLFFAWRIESNDFDPHLGQIISRAHIDKGVLLACLALLCMLLGYMGFVYLPGLIDAHLLGSMGNNVTANFFLLAAFIFLSTHHYIVDSVVWKTDSRARQLLPDRSRI